MKSLPAGLQADYQSENLTVCQLWRISLSDGSVVRLARHSAPVPLGAEVFDPALVFGSSAVEFTNGFEADSMEITVLLDGVTFTAADFESGRWSNAIVDILEVNYLDTTRGTNPIRRGRVGQLRITKTTCTIEARPLQAMLKQVIGRKRLSSCDDDLGGIYCGINLVTFPNGTIVGVTVGSVASRAQFTAAGLTQAADWFAGGLVIWTSGANVATPKAEVKAFALGGVVTLQLPMRNAIAPGDVFTIQVGCDKSWTTCQTKFANASRFQGYPHLPGMDRLQSGK